MDTEEKAAIDIKWTAEKIWENFLNCGGVETWFDVEESKNAPLPEKQRRNIEKFEIKGGIEILERKGDHYEIKVIREEFEKILRQFSNPRAAFNPYRLKALLPIALPKETKWEHIVIKFKNGHDVLITLKNSEDFQYKANYKEMGFQDNKRLIPNVQWKLLELLSKHNGELSWKNQDALLVMKKRKQLLSEQLQDYFQLKEDPFEVYRREKAYRLKLILLPEKN